MKTFMGLLISNRPIFQIRTGCPTALMTLMVGNSTNHLIPAASAKYIETMTTPN
jgi:hypothetical protein